MKNSSKIYEKAPVSPGVYLMKDRLGKIIYVGKAANLKRRVASYFLRPHDARIEALVHEIDTIQYKETDSALEALILESAMIKRHEPKYNIKDKDGKSFLYVEITRDKFPRVIIVRGRDAAHGVRFGPYVEAGSLRKALDIMRKIFPWADHGDKNHSKKPCFNYEIGLCPGTCIGKISREEYLKNINALKLFLRGEKKKIIKELLRNMKKAAQNLNFEEAAVMRRKIFALRHIHDVALIEKDKFAEGKPSGERIEGYDISNISGTSAVGAMVVFQNGKPAKKEYRLFKIKTIHGPNDTGMIKEVIGRRMKNNWPFPDVMLIDGGLGQVNASINALAASGYSIPVIGIAKGRDRKGNKIIGKIPKFTDIKTLIAVRDEAHRFSRNFHIRLRGKAMMY